MATCRECLTEVTYAFLGASGFSAAFDRDAQGPWVINDDGRAREATGKGQRYASHVRRCRPAVKVEAGKKASGA